MRMDSDYADRVESDECDSEWIEHFHIHSQSHSVIFPNKPKKTIGVLAFYSYTLFSTTK